MASIQAQAEIWREGAHNAFGDVIDFHGSYICAFREGTDHTVGGNIRILRSPRKSILEWESVTLFEPPAGYTYRDVKLTDYFRGLILSTVLYNSSVPSWQSVVFESPNGRDWIGPYEICPAGEWMWNSAGFKNKLWGVTYKPAAPFETNLYSSEDGLNWEHVSLLVNTNYTNECDLWEGSDGRINILMRRDSAGLGYPTTALLLQAEDPFTSWDVHDLGLRFACPKIVKVNSGSIIAAGRLYSPSRTSLVTINTSALSMSETLEIARAQAGDTGYPGVVVEGNLAKMVYYNDEGGQARIYGAEVAL